MGGDVLQIFRTIFEDQRLGEWADGSTLAAARVLNQTAGDLIALAEKEIALASISSGLFGQADFIAAKIAPLLREVAEPVAQKLIEEANRNLRELVEMQALWSGAPDQVFSGSGSFEAVGDVAMAAAPLAAGAATATALPFVAVTTTTAWFGLIATTAVSWPIVIGGGTVIGIGVATGILQASKIPERARSRLRRKVRDYITSSLITGTKETPSILQRLAAEYESAAERARQL